MATIEIKINNAEKLVEALASKNLCLNKSLCPVLNKKLSTEESTKLQNILSSIPCVKESLATLKNSNNGNIADNITNLISNLFFPTDNKELLQKIVKEVDKIENKEKTS